MSEKIKQISEMAEKTNRALAYYAYLLQERYLQEEEERKKNHEILKDLIKKMREKENAGK